MAKPRAAKIISEEMVAQMADHRLHTRSHRRDFIPDWYGWQFRLFAAGSTHRERMVLCGNRGGKTASACYEDALHLTGDYPDWWAGARFAFPINAWLFGVDGQQVREVLQKELLGTSIDNGKTYLDGWIHNDEIDHDSIERGQAKGEVKQLRIKHASGGYSVASFRSYTQISTGQSTLPAAGASVDLVHGDEQPPDSLVGQLVTRVMTGNRGAGGLVLWSMTPELGLTDLVAQFLQGPAAHQVLIGPISWEQCPHLTKKLRDEILASLPEHEREMRSKGIPMFGTGRIFRPDEEKMLVDPFDIRLHPWLKVIKAIDVGLAHPTAIAWMAYDPETLTHYLVRTYRENNKEAAVHGAVANSMWPNAPCVYPPDADTREKSSNASLLPHYGLKRVQEFSNPEVLGQAPNQRGREPGIMAMQEAMSQGRFRVFKGECEPFMEELRTYHRDTYGNVVDERDDVISAVRYAFQTVGRFGVNLEERNQEYAGGLYRDLGLRTRNTQRRRA